MSVASIGVSVIIPVFERPIVVRDALESIFMQTHKNIEIILVDDGSSSPISSSIKPYLNRILYIRHDKNQGVSSARNSGILLAKNEYIAFLDSDDVFLPDKIESQLNFMVQENLLISHTNEFWLKNGVWLNQGNNFERYGGKIFKNVLDKCRVSPSSLMVHKSVFKNIGLFDSILRVCEDYEWVLRAALNYDIGYLKTKFLIKRSITGDQLSTSIRHIECVRLDILENFARNHQPSGEDLDALNKELMRKKSIVKKKD